MATPEELIRDVRCHQCVGLVDGTKSAHRRPFGNLRTRIVSAGTVFMFIVDTVDSLLTSLGFAKAPGTRSGIWCARVESEEQLDALYTASRSLRCSAFAILIARNSIGALTSDFSSAGVITNPKAGYGSRAAQFSKLIARRHDNAALLTFGAQSDISRLYYSEFNIGDVIAALENLSDYRGG